MRAIALTSRARLAQLKDVPALTETVLPNFEVATWLRIYSPIRTPKPIIETVQDACLQVMKDTSVTDRLAAQSAQLLPAADYLGAALARHTETGVAGWRAVAARSGLTLE